MALKFYNTLTRKKEVFKPIVEGKVSYYSCGPTTYDYAHIGNFRAFTFYDVLKRVLQHKGFKVNHIMNLTDVDDKTIKGAKEAGISLKEFTEKYNQAFFDDLETLKIRKANLFPKATEYISEMLGLIKKLEKNGLTYKTDDGIYFSVSKFKDYGKLSKIKLKNLKTSKRVSADNYDKENASDFALWKFYKDEDGDVYWNSEYGKGRPGWHIECSAMSIKNLGNTFDIHAGGIDLIFPHHENEIAQSEGATNKKFANYWLHNEFILVDGKKMSKSLGNFHTLRDLLKKGYDPVSIRYLLLSTHYRQQLNFTFESVESSKNAVQRIQEAFDKLKNYSESKKGKNESENNALKSVSKTLVSKYSKLFEKALDDDVNMPEALAAVFDFIRELNVLILEKSLSKQGAEECTKLMLSFDDILGVIKQAQEIPKDVKELADKRQESRKNRNFSEADRLREQITKKGYQIDDSPEGYRIKKI